jgi:hypothetical protein
VQFAGAGDGCEGDDEELPPHVPARTQIVTTAIEQIGIDLACFRKMVARMHMVREIVKARHYRLSDARKFLIAINDHGSMQIETMDSVILETRAPFLHVANGSSTTGLIEAAGIPGTRSIWADPLHDGPVPRELDDAELLEVRRQYLAGPVSSPAWRGSDPSLDPANDLRQWRATIERHDSYGELILWFEHDLFDQLNLIQVLTWIYRRLPQAKPVSLVCIGSFPGRPQFKGLGELTPGELASLLDARQPVTESQYVLAERAWQAFREPTPEALDAFRDGDTAALPYLSAAITRFLQEYPWSTDGLSRTERRLLELADGSGISLRKAFPRMHDEERVYYVTDSSVADLAEGLSASSPPMLTLDLSRTTGRPGLNGSVALTDTGRAILAGRLDRVAACGIDRWLGGVHLHGHDDIWRWDDARRRITGGQR